MSQTRPTNASLRLRVDHGVLTASWIPPSEDEDAYALIVMVKFVASGCQWSSVPIQSASSTVVIDFTSPWDAEGYSRVQISAYLCRLLPLLIPIPKCWKVTKTAAVKADVRLLPVLDTKLIGK